MSVRRLSLALAALVLPLGCFAPAQATDSEHVTTRIVSDVKGVQPGVPFTLGVLFEIEHDWHIYWKAGQGIPTTVDLALPPGFKAEPFAYPTPELIPDPATPLYGYNGSVLLFARVTPPKDLAAVGSVSITASCGWLCCQRICLPGDATLVFAAPVVQAAAPDVDGAAAIARWRKKLPVDAAAAGVSLASVQGLDALASEGRLQAVVTLPEAPSRVDLFPAAPSALDVRSSKATANGHSVSLELDVAVLKGIPLDANELEAVVAYETPGGERRGVRLALPIRNSSRKDP